MSASDTPHTTPVGSQTVLARKVVDVWSSSKPVMPAAQPVSNGNTSGMARNSV
jgi:hypothetical protein